MSEALNIYGGVYRNAVYCAAGVAFRMSPAPTGERLFGGRTFALVTAYNPRSEPLTEAENRQRNAALEGKLWAGGYELAASSGGSQDGTWTEPGFVVFDLPLEEALRIGRLFEQHAVVWGEEERVALAWCDDGRLETFYPRILPEASEGALDGAEAYAGNL